MNIGIGRNWMICRVADRRIRFHIYIYICILRKITGPSKCIHRCDGEFGSALDCAAGSAVVDKIVTYSHASTISAMALSALSVRSEISDAPKFRA